MTDARFFERCELEGIWSGTEQCCAVAVSTRGSSGAGDVRLATERDMMQAIIRFRIDLHVALASLSVGRDGCWTLGSFFGIQLGWRVSLHLQHADLIRLR